MLSIWDLLARGTERSPTPYCVLRALRDSKQMATQYLYHIVLWFCVTSASQLFGKPFLKKKYATYHTFFYHGGSHFAILIKSATERLAWEMMQAMRTKAQNGNLPLKWPFTKLYESRRKYSTYLFLGCHMDSFYTQRTGQGPVWRYLHKTQPYASNSTIIWIRG